VGATDEEARLNGVKGCAERLQVLRLWLMLCHLVMGDGMVVLEAAQDGARPRAEERDD
jgi:hypothetical protein